MKIYSSLISNKLIRTQKLAAEASILPVTPLVRSARLSSRHKMGYSPRTYWCSRRLVEALIWIKICTIDPWMRKSTMTGLMAEYLVISNVLHTKSIKSRRPLMRITETITIWWFVIIRLSTTSSTQIFWMLQEMILRYPQVHWWKSHKIILRAILSFSITRIIRTSSFSCSTNEVTSTSSKTRHQLWQDLTQASLTMPRSWSF